MLTFSEFQVNKMRTGFQKSPYVEFTENDNILISWLSMNYNGVGNSLYFQKYALNSDSINLIPSNTEDIVLSILNESKFIENSLKILKKGLFYITLYSNYYVYGTIVNTRLSSLNSFFVINMENCTDATVEDMSNENENIFVVVWRNSYQNAIYFQLFSSNASNLTDHISINNKEENIERTSPSVKRLNDQIFLGLLDSKTKRKF